MRQYFLFFLIIAFLYTSNCNSQNIDSIRGKSWISIDYIRDMGSYLPCECFDSTNYYFYISITSKFNDKDIENDGQKIPEGILHQVIETEPTPFYILFADSTKYIISVDSKNKGFELTLNGDTLLLTDSISCKKFIKSSIPFDFLGSEYTDGLDNIALLNRSLSLRGHPTIQVILKEDSLGLDCNAWMGNINMVYSYKTQKSWVLEIRNGYLYIQKVLNSHPDPLDPIKTKVINKLKWEIKGKERQSRRKEYPVWVSPKK